MVTFLISSVGIVYAQDRNIDKPKDETVKVKPTGSKSTKGEKSSRLTDDTKGAGSDEVKSSGKKSFWGKLFGGKSAPEGHSSKAAASSRGGSSKSSAAAASSAVGSAESKGDKKPSGGGEEEEKGKENEDRGGGR
tara:strand:- start:1548 stop:1952 length:405 start_codon:yes stop_codon:yes gene_type:complete